MPTRDEESDADKLPFDHLRSVESLRLLLAALDPPLSAETVYGVAQSDVAIRCMESEFGLLTSVPEAGGGAMPISFMYRGELVYPGFQFTYSGTLQPAVQMLLESEPVAQKSGLDLALWIMAPSGYLEGARPVDCLANPRLVAAAAVTHFGVSW